MGNEGFRVASARRVLSSPKKERAEPEQNATQLGSAHLQPYQELKAPSPLSKILCGYTFSASTMGGLPRPLRVVGAAAGVLLGGFVAATLGAVAVYEAVRKREAAKRRVAELICGVCRGKGFYPCKLCRGDSTIQWSPLYDPIVINPCLCPTCDGKKVQRCLNCLGKGYA